MRRQDIAVVLLYWAGFSRLTLWLRRLCRRPVVVFLYLHDVPSTSRNAFERRLRYLSQTTNVISIEDFFARRLSVERLNVAITFDDGYESWTQTVLPLLRTLRLPATFFVCSGLLDLTAEEAEIFSREKLLLEAPHGRTACLRAGEVKAIVDAGCEIGGHTVNHLDMSDCSLNASRIKAEVMEDKRRLEQIVGKEVRYFAYPFGFCENACVDLRTLLREVGYEGAVTTKSGSNRPDTDAFLLRREAVDSEMSELVFRARLSGNYHAVAYVKRAIRGVLQRWIPLQSG